MNILNYAIDQESHSILSYLASILKTRPTEKKNLVEHKFGKNQLQAVHQVMNYGILNQIKTVVDEFGADVGARMHNQLSTLHCAAQSYCGYLSILVLV